MAGIVFGGYLGRLVYDQKKEDRGHVVSLVNTSSVADLSDFLPTSIFTLQLL